MGGRRWGIHLVKLGQGARNVWVKKKNTTAFQGGAVTAVVVDGELLSVLLCCQCVVLVLLSASFVHCTIPESMEACFLVVLGGGGGGVLLGRGGGMCCEHTQTKTQTQTHTHTKLNLEISIFSAQRQNPELRIKSCHHSRIWLTGLFIEELTPGSVYTTTTWTSADHMMTEEWNGSGATDFLDQESVLFWHKNHCTKYRLSFWVIDISI